MPYYVYIVLCKDGSYYTGYAKDLKHRVEQHKKGQEYQVWEEGSQPKLITNRKMLNQKLNYIHYNPVRCGYIDDPSDWRYSSYRHYVGKECLLPITVIE